VTVTTGRAGGRPRSGDVTGRVVLAARDAFAAKGFGAVTMSEIATSAGVGLDSIYRRWPSKQALLVDLVAHAFTADVTVPDSGSLVADLRVMLTALVRAVQSDLGNLLALAIAEAAQDAALAERLAHAQDVRRQATVVVIERAVARGELPADADGRLLLDTLAGLVWQRAWLNRASLTEADVRTTVTALVQGYRS
jgi:AcrR family transcriptional regulator